MSRSRDGLSANRKIEKFALNDNSCYYTHLLSYFLFVFLIGLELAYSQSPQHMKGLVMGAFLVTSGLGNYVATLLVVIVRSASNNKWYPSEDPNKGELENFFFLLAGLMMLNFVVFLLIASSYKYKTATRREEINSNVKDAGQSSDRDV